MASTRGSTRPGITLDDVARLAGVSQPTASRVLNGSDRKVGAVYRERVLRAARELGYLPNASAQAFARGTTPMISFVVGSITGTYFASLAAAIMREAEALGYQVSIAVTGRRSERELEVARELRSQRPRAIVLAGTGLVEPAGSATLIDELRRYEALGGRVVLISRTDLPFEVVTFDNVEGARELGTALAGLGYRRCLVLGSATPLLGMRERVDGFRAGFRTERSLVDVVETDLGWQGGRDAVRGLRARTLRRYDLLFGITDELALGAIAGLRELGLSIPSDVAVAGFNDIVTLRDVSPPLTTVHVPLDQVAEEAVRRATRPAQGLERRAIATYPVIRESTPPLR